MKKALFAILAVFSLVFAESYQVNTLSAKQLGMAHTGAGMKLGSESMHFNPGALGFLDKSLDASAGVTFIIPEVEFWGSKGKAVNDNIGTPLYVYLASNVIKDMLSVGLSFTTPYGNAADYGKDWEGAGLVQDISLAVYTLQPTIALKPISQISIGGGPTINFGSFSQSKRIDLKTTPLGTTLVPGMKSVATYVTNAVDFDTGTALEAQANTIGDFVDTPIDAKFEGDAEVAIGFHVGAMYEILPNKLNFGVSYRSKVDMKLAKGKVKGTGDLSGVNGALTRAKTILEAVNERIPNAHPLKKNVDDLATGTPTALPIPSETENFEATLPLPANLNTGISFRPIDNLLLAFDWQWVFWSAYKELELNFTDVPPVISKKNYHDAFAYRLGAQLTVIDQLDIRLGAYFDETPVDDEYLTPESPSTSKLGSTIGISYRPIPSLSIDASLLRSIAIKGRDATSGSNKDKVDNTGKNDGLDGRYEVTAWVPSIGLNFSF